MLHHLSLRPRSMARAAAWLGTLTMTAAIALPAPAGAQTRFGFVNMDKVFQGFYKTINADARFQKQKQLYTQHAKELAEEITAIKRQRDALQEAALNIALSDEVRAQKRKAAADKDALYEEKKKELKQFVQSKDRELGKKYLDLRANLVKEITDFLAGYAKKNGYDILFDSSGQTRNFIPVAVYFRKDLDLTEKVLTAINRGHEDEIAAAKKKKAAAKKAGTDLKNIRLKPGIGGKAK